MGFRLIFLIVFTSTFFAIYNSYAKLTCEPRGESKIQQIDSVLKRARTSKFGGRGEDPRVAAIYDKDGRTFVPQNDAPGAWIGRLSTDSNTSCTTYLVNDCTIASVGHCYRNRNITGAPAYRNPKFHPPGGGTPMPVQNVQAGDPRSGVDGEIAFAQIPVGPDGKYWGKKKGSFDIEEASAESLENDKESTYCVGGYSTDKTNADGSQALTADPDIKIRDYRAVFGDGPKEAISHTGDTFGGASGGPIYRCKKKPDGTFEYGNPITVVAMHIASPRDPLNPAANPKYSTDETDKDPMKMAVGISAVGFLQKAVQYVNDNPCYDQNNRPIVRNPPPRVASRQ